MDIPIQTIVEVVQKVQRPIEVYIDEVVHVTIHKQVEVSQPKGGAGQSIIGTLEVYKRDFFENLAKEETEESDAASEYDKTTQANRFQRQQRKGCQRRTS